MEVDEHLAIVLLVHGVKYFVWEANENNEKKQLEDDSSDLSPLLKQALRKTCSDSDFALQ